jgi:hypothetical protein
MKTIYLLAGALLLVGACVDSGGSDAESRGDEQNVTSAPPPLPADYEARSATQKLDTLWNERLVASKNAAPTPWTKISLFKLIALDLSVSLKHAADEMPAGRRKLVHERGSVAKIEFIADRDSPYTGMYKGGVGLARLSLAQDPGDKNFVPGLAIKLMVDGHPSENIITMLSIDGQGANFDFFANTFSNIIPDAVSTGGKIIAGIFAKGNPTPNHLDINAVGKRDRKGNEVARPESPEQLFFVPALSVKAVPRKSSPQVDFREDLANIPAGSTLYDVLASRVAGEAPVHIGKILTTSEMISARYGDEGLFFKHQGHGE